MGYGYQPGEHIPHEKEERHSDPDEVGKGITFRVYHEKIGLLSHRGGKAHVDPEQYRENEQIWRLPHLICNVNRDAGSDHSCRVVGDYVGEKPHQKH